MKNQYTGERTNVSVDSDKIALFLDKSTFSDRPEACPFFRFSIHEQKGYCCVHATRPEICRDYGCWRILIQNGDGERVGRIMASRHLASEDPALTRLLEDKIAMLHGLSDSDWDETVFRIVRAAGYTVRI